MTRIAKSIEQLRTAPRAANKPKPPEVVRNRPKSTGTGKRGHSEILIVPISEQARIVREFLFSMGISKVVRSQGRDLKAVANDIAVLAEDENEHVAKNEQAVVATAVSVLLHAKIVVEAGNVEMVHRLFDDIGAIPSSQKVVAAPSGPLSETDKAALFSQLTEKDKDKFRQVKMFAAREDACGCSSDAVGLSE